MVKRGIDVGSGSGIWALEMAKEFPEVQWTGLDLFAIERRPSQPSNVEYVKGNVLTGLDFPDGHFDIVHARHLITAVQNWRPVIDELVRITKPGGLIISVEICFPITVYNGTEEDTLKLAPGFAACHNVFMAAFKARGTDLLPGYTVATLLREHASVKETGQLESIFPFTPCTDDPNAIEAGRIMKENVLSMPESTRQIFMSKPGVTEEQFQQIKAGFTNDIERGIPLAAKLWHNWAWRR
ncbi:S-adenosyl-L-methionine-dependent methyltransferase [Kockovaella imperatae]|uniref:S-adenosyl-L-methionine-dependent methyltransferase n=1 Tax=Kockovaella imperatae TaxID=4999 RepID=A0A1Y1U9P7_9TREE|nr:S-adenosyl-L-methionine-dependent methyltransferase [Kockovaella imperatae]ORX34742.1 S-adenosyl-L-methionine-dependent methyltransferase [Kockovaella imperatae]